MWVKIFFMAWGMIPGSPWSPTSKEAKGQHPYIPQWEECEDELTRVKFFPEAFRPQANTELYLSIGERATLL